jgi:hypothetical protein
MSRRITVVFPPFVGNKIIYARASAVLNTYFVNRYCHSAFCMQELSAFFQFAENTFERRTLIDVMTSMQRTLPLRPIIMLGRLHFRQGLTGPRRTGHRR